MVGKLILRGIVCGIIGGLLAFGWARAFGEPSVATAINFETEQNEAKAAAAVAAGQKPEAEEEEIYSRTVQSGVGLLTGVVVIGAGLGGLFGILFAFANGRMGNLGPGATSMLLALFGLITIYLVPALKYPANPPSVGEPDTIKMRTGLYFLIMLISIIATVGAVRVQRALASRYGSWSGTLLAGAAYLIVIAAAFVLLPGINEVPANFPAVTLWNFRIASLGIQTVLWISTGVLFGSLAQRAARS